MRLVLILLVLAFAATGAIFGALNGETVVYDFYFTTLSVPKGAMLIGAVLIGWLLGGALVYFGLVLRLRAQIRATGRGDPGKEPNLPSVQPPLDAERSR
jgi:uncharacterized integral membrane protein